MTGAGSVGAVAYTSAVMMRAPESQNGTNTGSKTIATPGCARVPHGTAAK